MFEWIQMLRFDMSVTNPYLRVKFLGHSDFKVSRDKGSKSQQIDFDELCILASQELKKILWTHKTKDYGGVLWTLETYSTFTTLKCILFPVNGIRPGSGGVLTDPR